MKVAGDDLYEAVKPIYFPPELASEEHSKETTNYFCYIIGFTQRFDYDLPVSDVVLALRSELDPDISSLTFNSEADGGFLKVQLKYVGVVRLSSERVNLCRRFQITLFRILLGHGVEKLDQALTNMLSENGILIDYLLLPSVNNSFDWNTISSLLFPRENARMDHKNCPLTHPQPVHTKDGLVCKCMLENSIICTPHNGKLYCITDIHDLNKKSLMKLRSGGSKSYIKHCKERYGIVLAHDSESLIYGRHMFSLPNLLHNQRCRGQDKKRKLEARNAYVELPPELCSILMSPIAITTVYSFTLLPSIMHRIESLMTASNLKKMHLDHSMHDFAIPTIKVLEAITTKKCQDHFHFKSLATLGDSFLKYAAGQQLFQSHQTDDEGLLMDEGLLSINVCNDNLCMLGCKCKLPGFIRDEPFDPKFWLIPGDNSGSSKLDVEFLSEKRKIFVRGNRTLTKKRIADVVEALIGAYLTTGGETAALLFMDWLGIKMDLIHVPYRRDFEVQSEIFLNVSSLQFLLNYSFKDPSLLVEALTHGSVVPKIPRSYQRLEFLGDAVLDYLITEHLYKKYPGLSPGLLTDMRSASVNNDCYARSSVKAGLYKYIFHDSHELRKHIASTVVNYKEVSPDSTFGWESEMSFPMVLADIIESLAGAILVDSGYDKEVVFRCIRPLLEPLVTPDSVPLQPFRELKEFCEKHHFELKKPAYAWDNGEASVTVEVEANGPIFKHTTTAANKKTAKKLAAKKVLAALKANIL